MEADPFVKSYPELREFWTAANEGRFLIRMCTACGRAHWYPRVICPLCGNQDLKWEQSNGKGTVFSYSVMRRVQEPYVLAYVLLDEGPMLLTNIVDCPPDDVRIDRRVSVSLRRTAEGRCVPYFCLDEMS